jgi:hypothetical protein
VARLAAREAEQQHLAAKLEEMGLKIARLE